MSDGTRVPTACDQCHAEEEGDTAPKLHYGNTTFHHDCLPAYVEQDVTRFADTHPLHASTKRIIEACKAGTKNDELHTFITGEHATRTEQEYGAFLQTLAGDQNV